VTHLIAAPAFECAANRASWKHDAQALTELKLYLAGIGGLASVVGSEDECAEEILHALMRLHRAARNELARLAPGGNLTPQNLIAAPAFECAADRASWKHDAQALTELRAEALSRCVDHHGESDASASGVDCEARGLAARGVSSTR